MFVATLRHSLRMSVMQRSTACISGGSCSSSNFLSQSTMSVLRGNNLLSSPSSLQQPRRFAESYNPNPQLPPEQLSIDKVEERVLRALRNWDRFPAHLSEKITLDSNFIKDLGLDSLDHVEIMVAIEDEFSFEIPDGDMERLMTPRDIMQYICDRNDVYE